MRRKDFKQLIKKHMSDLTYTPVGAKYVNQSKYGNHSCSCISKHLHQSILEADYCNELYFLKKTNAIKDYKIQHKLELWVQGKKITNHYVDFLVIKNNGDWEFHEVKGYEQDVWKIKKKLTEALFPTVPYIVKNQKLKYAYLLSKMRAKNRSLDNKQ